MKRPLNRNPSSSGGEIELDRMTTKETSIGDDARGGETMSSPRGVEFLTAPSGGEARSNNFSTDDFPPIIRFTLLYVFGRYKTTYPILIGLPLFLYTFGLLLPIYAYIMVISFQIHQNGDTNDDDYYPDTDDNGITPLQAGLTVLATIFPRVISLLAFLSEFLVNLYFGNWIARSRYLENVIQMLYPGGTGHEAACSLRYIWYLAIAVGFVGIIIPVSIQAYFKMLILRTTDTQGINVDFVMALTILWPLIFIPAVLLSLFFMFLWLWLCYQRNENPKKGLEDTIAEKTHALQEFVDNISLMQGYSKPWTVSMIVRLVCSLYQFWYNLREFKILLAYVTSGQDTVTISLVLLQIFILLAGLVVQFGVMLLVAFASGLVGDMYHEDVIRSLRHQMSSEPRKEVRAVIMEFLMYANLHKGQAGLLFCGVEMGTEKAFYLVTVVSYIYIYLIDEHS